MGLSSKRVAIDFIISGIGRVLLRKIKEGGRIRNDGRGGGGSSSVIWWSGSWSGRVFVDLYRPREQPVQDGSGEWNPNLTGCLILYLTIASRRCLQSKI